MSYPVADKIFNVTIDGVQQNWSLEQVQGKLEGFSRADFRAVRVANDLTLAPYSSFELFINKLGCCCNPDDNLDLARRVLVQLKPHQIDFFELFQNAVGHYNIHCVIRNQIDNKDAAAEVERKLKEMSFDNDLAAAEGRSKVNYSLRALASFYQGDVPHPTKDGARGRTLQQIWDMPDKEAGHDFIQWLFPIKERSGFNDEAPVFDDLAYTTLAKNPKIIANMIQSFQVMLRHYGLKYVESTKTVEPRDKHEGDSFAEREAEIWKQYALGHNLLRMSRMLQSLCEFGLVDQARAFLYKLIELYDTGQYSISEETLYRHWLQIIPDIDLSRYPHIARRLQTYH